MAETSHNSKYTKSLFALPNRRNKHK